MSTEVCNYLDRTLEEVTAETAESLLSADMDVESRSAAIRYVCIITCYVGVSFYVIYIQQKMQSPPSSD